MTRLTTFLFIALLPLSARATSLQDFESMTSPRQGTLVADYVDKMATSLETKNAAFAQAIRDWFSRKNGRPFSEGLEKLNVEILANDALAREGKADKSKIQIEGMIVSVVRQKFAQK